MSKKERNRELLKKMRENGIARGYLKPVVYIGKAPKSFITGKKEDDNILTEQIHIISKEPTIEEERKIKLKSIPF